MGASAAFADEGVRAQLGLAFPGVGVSTQAGDAADGASSLPQATTDVVADVPTQDIWTQYLNNTKTEYAGNVWADKSVTADESTTLTGYADDPITVYRNDGSTSDGDPSYATFLTDLSALSSSAYVQTLNETPLDIVLVVNTSSSMSQRLFKSTSETSRLDAMRQSLSSLITQIAQENAGLDGDSQHRISIVKFSGGYYDGTSAPSEAPGYQTGNGVYSAKDADGLDVDLNYTQVVLPLTAPTSANMSSLTSIVTTELKANPVNAGGGSVEESRTDRGMTLALGVLAGEVGKAASGESDARDGAQKVVVFFDDETTGTVSSASGAVNLAHDLKAEGGKVYAVGFFADAANTAASGEDADAWLEVDANRFLAALSSGYAEASANGSAATLHDAITLGDATGNSYDFYAATQDGTRTYPRNVILQDDFRSLVNRIVESSNKLPTTQSGGDASLTFVDQLGAYMEVKDVKGLVYGPGVRSLNSPGVQEDEKARLYVPNKPETESTNSDGDTVVSYYFDYDVLPVYTVDVEDYATKHTTPVNLGGSGDSGQIRVTVTKSADVSVGDRVEVSVPPRLLPLLEYEVRYDQTSDDLPHLYRSEARPLHLFYSSGLKADAVELIDEAGSQMILPASEQSGDYRAYESYRESHSDADSGVVSFYNDEFDPAADEEADVLDGTTVATFGISETNRYYYFIVDKELYIMDDEASSDYAEGTVYGDSGGTSHRFVRATLANTGGTAGEDGTISGIDAADLWYLPNFYEADALGGVARLNTAWVQGSMQNFSRTNPSQAVNVADVRADDDGRLYVPAGTKENHHRGHLDTVKSDIEVDGVSFQPAGGLTDTALNVLEAEIFEHVGHAYLGNNGRIDVQPYGMAEVSNTVTVAEGSGLFADHDKEFTYTLKSLTSDGAQLSDDHAFEGEPSVYVAIYDGDMLTAGARKLEVGGTFTLTHGQKALIGGLPAGWTFEVEQAVESGYTTTGANADGSQSGPDRRNPVSVTGVAQVGVTAETSFTNEFGIVEYLLVPTSEDEVEDAGLIQATKVMTAGKELQAVESPFLFYLYDEAAFDVQTGEIAPGALPLAEGASTHDGHVVWTLRTVFDSEGAPTDNPLRLSGATGDEGVRFYLSEVETPARSGHAGVQFSTAIYEAEVVAADADADGNLEVSIEYGKVAGTGADDEPDDVARFHNKYVSSTYSTVDDDGSYVEGALHVDVSETLRGRNLQGRGHLRFIMTDSSARLLDPQGEYVLDDQGNRVNYLPGQTDFNTLYENALPLDADAVEGSAAIMSFFRDAQLSSESLPSYWAKGTDGQGRATYTAQLSIVQLQRFYDADGEVEYLSNVGVSYPDDFPIERDVVVVLTDDGEGALDASVDYGADSDGNAYDAAVFVNVYTPTLDSPSEGFMFEKRVLGRELLADQAGNKTETFQFYIAATGDYAAIAPLPGGTSANADQRGIDDQYAYTDNLPSTSTVGGQRVQVGSYAGDSAIELPFEGVTFTQDDMVSYRLDEDGAPVRDEQTGELVVERGEDGTPKHVTERTFTYQVREVGADGEGSFGGVLNGLSYDSSTIAEVSYTVVDDQLGNLQVSDSFVQLVGAVSSETGAFANVYSATAHVDAPEIETTLLGHDLAADQFTYTVRPVDTEAADGVAGSSAVDAAVKAGMVEADAPEADKLRATVRGITVGSGLPQTDDAWDSDAQRYKAVTTEALFDALTFYNTDLESDALDSAGNPTYEDARRYSYEIVADRMPGSRDGYTYDATSSARVTFTVRDDHLGNLHVDTAVVKGGQVLAGEDAVISFQNAYDASTLPASNPSFDGGARITCLTKRLTGADADAGAFTFTTSLVNRSNEQVGESLPAAGRTTQAISDGGTSPIAFYEVDDEGAATSTEFGLQFTLAELEKLRHDYEGEMVVTKSIAEGGEPVYSVRLQAVEDASATATPKRRTLYYMAEFTDNGDGTLSGVVEPTSSSLFENARGDTHDFSVVGIVWIDGRAMDARDVFDFRIEPVGDAPLRFSSTQTSSDASKTVSSEFIDSDGHGRVDFGDLHFKKSDLGPAVADGSQRVFTYRVVQLGSSSGPEVRDNDGVEGFTLDADEELIHVLVRWDEDAQNLYVSRIESENAGSAEIGGDFVFENTYRINQGVTSALDAETIAIRKYLTGRDLVDDGFSVTLAAHGADEWALSPVHALVKADSTTENTHDGFFDLSVDFPAKLDILANSYDHEYSFELTEGLVDDRGGRVYDRSRYRLTANVTDDKAGGLRVVWDAVRTHDANGATLDEPVQVETDAIVFDNWYNATGQIPMSASKRMAGRKLFGDGFTFNVQFVEYLDVANSVGEVPVPVGDPIATATNDENGSVNLGVLYVSAQDLSGVTAAGYLESLDASGFDRLGYYSLADLVGQGIARAGTDDGHACWDIALLLTESFDSEEVPDVEQSTYGYVAALHLVDDANGGLVPTIGIYSLAEDGSIASASETGSRQFVNTYSPEPLNPSMTDMTGGSSEGIAVYKMTSGRDQVPGEYAFELTDTSGNRNVVATGVNAATAVEGLDAVDMSAFVSPDYYFTSSTNADGVKFYLRELPTDSNGNSLESRGIAYDSTVHRIRAVVSDEVDENGKPNGHLKVKWSAYEDGAWVDSVMFRNAYEAVETSLSPTSAENAQALTLKVAVQGRAIRSSEFEYALYREADYPAGEPVSTGRNRPVIDVTTDDGAYLRGIVMSALSEPITQQGTTSYKLVQVAGNAGGMTYDSTVYDVRATAVDSGSGTLNVSWEVVGPGEPTTEVTFQNVYALQSSSDPASLAFAGALDGRPWKAGEQFMFTLTATGENASVAPLPLDGTNAQVDSSAHAVTYVAEAPEGGTATVGATAQLTTGSFIVTPDMMDGSESKTFTYTLAVNASDQPATTVDDHVATLSLHAYDDGHGGISTQLDVSGSTQFINRYQVVSQTYTLLQVSKTLQGWSLDAASNRDHRFQFGITPVDHASALKAKSRVTTEQIVGLTTQRSSAGVPVSMALDCLSNVTFTQDDVASLAWDDPGAASPVRSRTYSYTLREIIPDEPADGYTYDETVYTAMVRLVDDGNGALSATTTVTDQNGAEIFTTVCADGNSQIGTVPFVNVYHAAGTLDFTAEKKLVGRHISEDMFQFTLTPTTVSSLTDRQFADLRDSLAHPGYLDVQTRFNDVQRSDAGSSAATGYYADIDFDPITFDVGDLSKLVDAGYGSVSRVGGVVTYSMTFKAEEVDTPALTDDIGITRTVSSFGIIVRVVDTGSGNVSFSVTDNAGNPIDKLTFVNTYEPKPAVVDQNDVALGSALTFTKLLSGRAVSGTTPRFRYTLSPSTQTSYDYADAGTTPMPVSSASATVNNYTESLASLTGAFAPDADGHSSTASIIPFGVFKFTKANMADGIELSNGHVRKVFEYELREDMPSEGVTEKDGITYEDRAQYLQITVEDDLSGQLKVVDVTLTRPYGATFTNLYRASAVNSDAGSGAMSIAVTLNGSAMTAGQMQFEVKAEDADSIALMERAGYSLTRDEQADTASTTLSNTAAHPDGDPAEIALLRDVVFNEYDLDTTFTFYLSQANDAAGGYLFDSTRYKMEITPVDSSGNGVMAVETVLYKWNDASSKWVQQTVDEATASLEDFSLSRGQAGWKPTWLGTADDPARPTVPFAVRYEASGSATIKVVKQLVSTVAKSDIPDADLLQENDYSFTLRVGGADGVVIGAGTCGGENTTPTDANVVSERYVPFAGVASVPVTQVSAGNPVTDTRIPAIIDTTTDELIVDGKLNLASSAEDSSGNPIVTRTTHYPGDATGATRIYDSYRVVLYGYEGLPATKTPTGANADNYHIDSSKPTIAITLNFNDEGNGTLTGVPSYPNGSSYSYARFRNFYELAGERTVGIQGTTSLTTNRGYELRDGEIEFSLSSETPGAPLPGGTAASTYERTNQGTYVDLTDITFKASDLSSGAVDSGSGYKYKDFVYKVEVKPTEAQGSWTIGPAQKLVFRVKLNDATGELTRERYRVDEGGEDLALSSGETCKVVVLGDSELALFNIDCAYAVAAVSSSPLDWDPSSTVEKLSISKKLEGRPLVPGGFQFVMRGTGAVYGSQFWYGVNGKGVGSLNASGKFEVAVDSGDSGKDAAGNAIDGAGNLVDGSGNALPETVVLPAVTFTQPGRYYFVLWEDASANPSGMSEGAYEALSFSEQYYDLMADVTLSDGALSVAWTATDPDSGDPVTNLVFTNSYEATADAVTFPLFSIMQGRDQYENGFVYKAVSPVGASWTDDANVADRAVWWAGHNGNGLDTARVSVIQDAVGDGDLDGKMTSTVLDGAVDAYEAYYSSLTPAEKANVDTDYAPTKASVSIGGTGHDIWCLPLVLSQQDGSVEHENVEQLVGYDEDLDLTAAASYDITAVVLDDNQGSLTVRVVHGKLKADDVASMIAAAGVTSLSGAIADEKLAGTSLNVVPTYFVNQYRPNPTDPVSVSDLYEMRKVLTGRDIIDGEFDFALTLASESRAEFVEVQDGAEWKEAPEVIHGHAKADGSIVFDAVRFLQAGDYTYTLREVQDGSAAGMEYGGERYRITATVSDNLTGGLPNGVLSLSWAAEKLADGGSGTLVRQKDDANADDDDVILFENTYSASTLATGGEPAQVEATKTLQGRPLTAGAFQFDLTMQSSGFAKQVVDLDAATLGDEADEAEVVASAHNVAASAGAPAAVLAADGNPITLEYTANQLEAWAAAGIADKGVEADSGKPSYTLYYTLSENLDASAWGGDNFSPVGPSALQFKVKVVDNADGSLSASMVQGSVQASGEGGSQEVSGLAFANTYEPVSSDPVGLRFYKTLTGAYGHSRTFAFELIPQTSGETAAPIRVVDDEEEGGYAYLDKLTVSGGVGSLSFPEMVFTADDLEDVPFSVADEPRTRVFRYTLHEACYALDEETGEMVDLNADGDYVDEGVAYAADQTVEVRVSDNASDIASGKLEVAYQEPTVANAYDVSEEALVSVPFGDLGGTDGHAEAGSTMAWVALDHRDMAEGEFTFDLYYADEGVGDANWRTAANKVASGTNEATVMEYIERPIAGQGDKVSVALNPTPGRILFDEVVITSAMRGGAGEADVYFKLVQNVDGASAGYGSQAGERVRRGVALDQKVYDVRAHVTDNALGGLDVTWRVKDADDEDVPENWATQVDFRNSYDAQGAADITAYTQLSGRILRPNGLWYHLQLGEGLDESFTSSNLATYDQYATNARITNPNLSVIRFDDVGLSLSDFHKLMEIGVADVDAKADIDSDDRVTSVTYVLHMAVSELDGYTDPQGNVYQWPSNVNVVEGVYDVSTVTVEGNAVPGVYYTPEDGAVGQRKPTYRVDITAVDDGKGNLTTSTVYPQLYKEAGTVVDAGGNSFSVEAGQRLSWVEFNNAYEPDDVQLTVSGTKDITGRDLDAYPFGRVQGETFLFDIQQVVLDSQGDETLVNPENWVAGTTGRYGATAEAAVPATDGKSGTVTFGDLAFSADLLSDQPMSGAGGARSREFTYQVTERARNFNGITSDTRVRRFTVRLHDNITDSLLPVVDGTLGVDVVAAAGASGSDEFSFVNAYSVASVVSTPTSSGSGLVVTQEMRGDLPLRAGDMVYEMVDDQGAVVARGLNLDDSADGSDDGVASVVMTQVGNGLTFTHEQLRNADGSYASHATRSYTLRQIAGSAQYVTYDATEYPLVATLDDDGRGTLSVSWTIRDSADTNVNFVDEYAPDVVDGEVGVTLWATNLLSGRDLTDPQNFVFSLRYPSSSSAGQGSAVYPQNSGQPLPSVTGSGAADGVRTSAFKLAELEFSTSYLKQLVSAGRATKVEPTLVERVEAAARGERAKTTYTVRYVAQEDTGDGVLPAGVIPTVSSCGITVTIEDDEGGNMEVASVAYGDAGANAAAFANAYNTARDVAFRGTETMVGRDLSLADVFHARLAYANGDAVIPLDDAGAVMSGGGQSVEADISGTAADGEPSDAVTFAVLRFSSENLKALEDLGYAQVVKQPTDGDPSIAYSIDYIARQSMEETPSYVSVDTSTHAVQVVVTDSRNAEGAMSVRMSVDGRETVDVDSDGIASDAVGFENSYDAPYSAATTDATAATVLARAKLSGRAIGASDLSSFRYSLVYADGTSVSQPRVSDPTVRVVTLPTPSADGAETDPAFSLGKLHYTSAFLDQLVAAGRAEKGVDAEGNDTYSIGYLAKGDVMSLPESVSAVLIPCQLPVTVVVTDDGSGVLTTAVDYGDQGSDCLVFAYAYTVAVDGEGSTTVYATARMDGRALLADELFFGMYVVNSSTGVRAPVGDVLSLTGVSAGPADYVPNPSGAPDGVASDPFSLGTLNFKASDLADLVARGYATHEVDAGSNVYTLDLVAYQAGPLTGVTFPEEVSIVVGEVPFGITIVDDGTGVLDVRQDFADEAVSADFVDRYGEGPVPPEPGEVSVDIQAQTVLTGRRTIDSDEGKFQVRLFYKGTDVPAESSDGAVAEIVASGITKSGSAAKLAAGEASPLFTVGRMTYTAAFLEGLESAGRLLSVQPMSAAVLNSFGLGAAEVASLSAQALDTGTYRIDYEVAAVDSSGRKLASGDAITDAVAAANTSFDVSVIVGVVDGEPTSAVASYDGGLITNAYQAQDSNVVAVKARTQVLGSSPAAGDYTVRAFYADAGGEPVASPEPDGAQAISTPGASSSGSDTTDAYTVLDFATTADQLNALVEGGNGVASKTLSDGSDGDVDTYEVKLVIAEDTAGGSLPAHIRPVTPRAYAKVTARENLADGSLTLSVAYLDEGGNPTSADAALLVNSRYSGVSDGVTIEGTKELFGNDSGLAAGAGSALMVSAASAEGASGGTNDLVSASLVAGEPAASSAEQFMAVAAEQATNRAIVAGGFTFQLRYGSATGPIERTAVNGDAFEEGGNKAPIVFEPLVYGYSTEDGAVNLLDLVDAGHAAVTTVDDVSTYTIRYVVTEASPGAGMQPNDQAFGVVVTVVDDPANDKLIATAELGDGGIAFVNTYLADRVTYAVDTTVGVSGDHEVVAGEYEFSITPTGDNAASAPLPSGGSTAVNDAAGSVHFGNLEFTYDMLAGRPSATFAYVVHQVVRDASGMDVNPGDGTLVKDGVTYPADYMLTVAVADTGDGYLSAQAETSGAGSFVVRYPTADNPVVPDNPSQPDNPGDSEDPPDSGDSGDSGSKPDSGAKPSPQSGNASSSSVVRTGDAVSIALALAACCIAALVACAAFRKLAR